MVSVKPEVIQCAPANRVGVLIGRKSFRVPSNGARILGNDPWSTTVALTVKRAVIWPPRFLRRGVKPDVTNIDPRSQGNTKRLNGAIEVLVIQRVFVVPDSGRRIGHLISHEPDTIVSWVRLDRGADCCASPGQNGGLLPHCVSESCKGEIGRAAYRELTVGDIVKHVALVRMSLAPGIFMRTDVCGFAKIEGARILRGVQVANLDPDTVRNAVVIVVGVVIGI